MRQLWQTGWMHNRVRMAVASFLVKDLLMPWQIGARWFWDTLVDADLANNTLGWQWSAGCGFDAAPFTRVFNPTLQAERFDAKGDYIRRYVPELANLAAPYIQRPFEAPPLELARQKAIDIVSRCEFDRPRVRLERLHDHAAGGVAAAPPRELRQELERSLLRAEVGQRETGVRVDDSGERDALRFVAAVAEQTAFETIKPRQLFLRRERGMVGNIIGDADELIEGEDRRPVPALDQPGGDREVLVARALAGPQLRARRHCRLGALT
jgi:hypothetical protein